MELRHLRYFLAVADECHFGRAAARLHVTQSTLSTQIRDLEREAGGALFSRTSRRVELTEAGDALLPEARRAVAQAERALEAARRSIAGEIGAIRIGFAGVAVLHGQVMDDLHRFQTAHPQVEVELTELSGSAQVRQVLDGALDVGYCPDLVLHTDHGLQVLHRADLPLSVALRADHPLAASDAVTPADLLDHDLIVFAEHGEDESTTVVPLLWPTAQHAHPRLRIVNSTLGLLALTAAGSGVAVVPSATERIRLPDLVYRPIAGAVGSAAMTVISRPDETSGAVRAFLGGIAGGH